MIAISPVGDRVSVEIRGATTTVRVELGPTDVIKLMMAIGKAAAFANGHEKQTLQGLIDSVGGVKV